MNFRLLLKKYLKNIDNKSSIVFRDAIIICLVCGSIIGLRNVFDINNILNQINMIVSDKDFDFQISNDKFEFSGEDKSGYINDIEYYISGNKILSEADSLKQNNITKKNYIIILKDGVQVSAGIVGMNSYLDTKLQYSNIFLNNLNKNDLLEKLSKIKIFIFMLVILECILFSICEFFVQILFITIIIWFISKILINQIHFEYILKLSIYISFIPKIIYSLIQIFGINYKFPQIMLVAFCIFPYLLLIQKNNLHFLP